MSRRRPQNPYGYNRPSGGFQKNMVKQQMEAKGVKQPKPLDEKKLVKWGRILLILWAVLIIGAGFLWKWIGVLVVFLIGCAVIGGIMLYFRHYGDESLKYYQAMGMPKDMYLKELKKKNVDKKQIERSMKSWDRIAEKTGYEPIVKPNRNATKKKRKRK